MNRRQKIIVSVVGIFIVLLALVGLTYGYFLTRIQGNTNTRSITVTTADLQLTYGDGTTEILTKSNIMPDTVIGTKDFTVTNNGNDTEYVVVIEDVLVTYAENGTTIDGDNVTKGQETTFNSPKDFVYTLTCTKSDGTKCNGVDNSAFPMKNTQNIIVGNDIIAGETHNYNLTVTYLETGENQSKDMNKALSAKVNIEDIRRINPYSDNTSSLAYNIINNAIGLTNEDINNGYAELVAIPKTKPAEEASAKFVEVRENETSTNVTTNNYFVYGDDYRLDELTGKYYLVNPQKIKFIDNYNALKNKYLVNEVGFSTEEETSDYLTEEKEHSNIVKVTKANESSITYQKLKKKRIGESSLSTTLDDYGTSYYYRGDVKNNYLTFNQMCWRIVRIEGDGSVKIVLADKDEGCNENTLTKNNSAFIGKGIFGLKNENEFFLADFKNNNNRTDAMKYRFDIFLNGGSFEEEIYNEELEDSETITYSYSAWSEENLSKLKEISICIGDKTNLYNLNGNIYTKEELEQLHNEVVLLHYKNSLDYYTNKTASLMCKGGEIITNKVLPLTLDEVVYAGISSTSTNMRIYLRDNTNNDWLLSSLSHSFVKRDTTFIFLNDGQLGNVAVTNQSNLRPAVSLIPGTEIIRGTGTYSDPYYIS